MQPPSWPQPPKRGSEEVVYENELLEEFNVYEHGSCDLQVSADQRLQQVACPRNLQIVRLGQSSTAAASSGAAAPTPAEHRNATPTVPVAKWAPGVATERLMLLNKPEDFQTFDMGAGPHIGSKPATPQAAAKAKADLQAAATPRPPQEPPTTRLARAAAVPPTFGTIHSSTIDLTIESSIDAAFRNAPSTVSQPEREPEAGVAARALAIAPAPVNPAAHAWRGQYTAARQAQDQRAAAADEERRAAAEREKEAARKRAAENPWPMEEWQDEVDVAPVSLERTVIDTREPSPFGIHGCRDRAYQS